MRKKALPHDLQFRVRRYLEHMWEYKKKKNLDERQIMSLLSEPLRDDVNDHIHGVILKNFPVFAEYDTNFISQMTKKFEKNTYAPGDIVLEEGEISTSIYFIQTGRIELFHHATRSIYKIINPRDYFGEIAFFTERPRCASARCLDYTDLLSLSRGSLNTLV